MNLRSVANGATQAVNPNVPVVLQASTGSTTSASGKVVPTYAAPVTLQGNVQGLRAEELDQVNGLNLEGVLRKLYVSRRLNGVVRAEAKGGDLVTVEGHVWKVVLVFEAWPDWSAVMINMQVS